MARFALIIIAAVVCSACQRTSTGPRYSNADPAAGKQTTARSVVIETTSDGSAADEPTADAAAVEPGGRETTAQVQSEVRDELPGDWPKWRGRAGDGIVRDNVWQSQWPSTGPKQIWSAEVGTGFSSTSVVAGRLYTMGHADGNDTVWCLNAETGDVLWKHVYPCKLVDNLHAGGPACTPTVLEDRVYTLSKEGHLFCFDRLTGEVHWKQELQPLLEMKMPEWGFSCSPLPWQKWLIIEAGRTVAIDWESGELAWKTDVYRSGYGSPTLFTPAGEDLLAVLNNDYLLVVRAADGSEVDKYPWVTSFATNSTSPVVWQDTIFISTAYGHGSALLRLVGGKLELVWESKGLRNHMNNSVLWQGHFYGIDGNSNLGGAVSLACLEYETGKEKWRERGLGCGSLLIADGTLIVLGDSGELVTAPAAPAGFAPVSRAQVIDGLCWTVPVLAQGRIYCRNSAGRLVALDVR
jgi:outer membrane protein assembly factor BamB